MARLPDEALAGTYTAAERFVHAALRHDDSLFTPGRPIWTAANLDVLVERFVNHPGFMETRFDEQFRRQLEGTSDDVHQLAAEVLYAYSLPASQVGGPSKRQGINEVLGRMGQPIEMPEDLSVALDHGFGSGGTSYSTRKPKQLQHLIRFVRHWKSLPTEDREHALDHPMQFKTAVEQVPVEEGAHFMREALLYLVHPHHFERIFSDGHKRAIIDRLGGLAPDVEDRDERLARIREVLADRYGQAIDFYDSTPVRALWWPDNDRWRTFLYWADRFKSLPSFEEDEVDYKLRIAAKVRAARDAMLAGGSATEAGGAPEGSGYSGDPEFPRVMEVDFRAPVPHDFLDENGPTHEAIRRKVAREIGNGNPIGTISGVGEPGAGTSGRARVTYRLREDRIEGSDADWVTHLRRSFNAPNNLTSFHAHGRFMDWVQADPERAKRALEQLWTGEGDGTERIGRFLEQLPADVISGRGIRTTLAAFLLLAEDPERYPPFKTTEFERAYALTEFASQSGSEMEIHASALLFLDTMLERGAELGLEFRSRLEAQGAMWSVLTGTKPEAWTEDEWQALEVFRGSRATERDIEVAGEPPEPAQIPTSRPDPIPGLANELLVAERELREIVALMDAKRQVIFYGPPGTGKTFLALKLARALAGDPDRVRIVQFHPSYAYEDFVEGYRPRLQNGQPGFELVDGPLKKVAAAAAGDSENTYYLIIDEVNRGNVAKVLGELYFLLEYRDEKAELLYSGTGFSLPRNLRIIGTMNTADRSIALMDAALRRRFGFIAFFPDQPPMEGLLRRWLTRNKPDMLWVAAVVDAVNVQLADRNSAVGPSYFLRAGLDDERMERIWRHEIRPYLEEFFFDQPERMKDFELPRIRARLAGAQPDPDEAVSDADADAEALDASADA